MHAALPLAFVLLGLAESPAPAEASPAHVYSEDTTKYLTYLFIEADAPVQRKSEEPIIRTGNILWDALHKKCTYESAAKKLGAIDNSARLLLDFDSVIFGLQPEAGSIDEKYGQELVLVFVEELCKSMSVKDDASVEYFLKLWEVADGYFGEYMWKKFHYVLLNNPDVVLKHVNEFAKYKDTIRFVANEDIDPEEQDALVKLYRQRISDQGAKQVLSWISREGYVPVAERPENR